MKQFAVTTVDNPYDPFTEFNEWLSWDTARGYHTASYLARITRTSDQLPDAIRQADVERAIDEMIEFNGPELYRKVSREIEEV